MPFADFSAPEWMQVFVVFLVVPANPAVREFLTLGFLSCAAVNIYRIIELLEYPAVAAGLLKHFL